MSLNFTTGNAIKDIFTSSSSLLIERHGDFTLYHYEHDSTMMTDDNDLIMELSWAVAVTFQNIHTHTTLALSPEELFPRVKSLIYDATKKIESLLYYIRYEPNEETQQLLSETDPKYRYINKIVAVNVLEDHSDPIGAAFSTSNEKLRTIRALAETAHEMYIKYLEENILDQTELQHLLTNRHQLIYLSVSSVRQEFQNQGLYKWFQASVMNHIQQRNVFMDSASRRH